MLTMGDYSSVVEVGFGLNLAISYVNMFVSPSVVRAERDIARFRWWIDSPGRLQEVAGRQLDPAAFEEALSDWLQAADRMRKAIEDKRKAPTYFALLSALILYVAMYFPSFPAHTWALLFVAALSVLPVTAGSIYLWARTRAEVEKERHACGKANRLFVLA